MGFFFVVEVLGFSEVFIVGDEFEVYFDEKLVWVVVGDCVFDVCVICFV